MGRVWKTTAKWEARVYATRERHVEMPDGTIESTIRNHDGSLRRIDTESLCTIERCVRDGDLELVPEQPLGAQKAQLRRLLVEYDMAPPECLEGLEEAREEEPDLEGLLQAIAAALRTVERDSSPIEMMLRRAPHVDGRMQAIVQTSRGKPLMHVSSGDEIERVGDTFFDAARAVARQWLEGCQGLDRKNPDVLALEEMLDRLDAL